MFSGLLCLGGRGFSLLLFFSGSSEEFGELQEGLEGLSLSLSPRQKA